MVEIISDEKQADVDKFLDSQKEMSKVDLWMALRKYECWVWTSDTPMCYKNWIEESPTNEGGLTIYVILGKQT